MASKVAIMASVDPQQTTISFSGSTSIPCHSFICRAIALRRFFAPQVMAYWFTSAAMASCAARLISAGAEKSGKPCARLTASYCIACRVISRITDSVKCSTLSERKCLGWAETWVMGSSLAQELPPRDTNGSGSVHETLNHSKGHEGTRRKALTRKTFVILRVLGGSCFFSALSRNCGFAGSLYPLDPAERFQRLGTPPPPLRHFVVAQRALA